MPLKNMNLGNHVFKMFKMFKIFLILFLSISLSAETFFVKKVISVYDGDTFRVNLDCTEKFFCENISVRVQGVDTEEIKTKSKNSILAKQYTEEFLLMSPIILQDCKKDKYFRINCRVKNFFNQDLTDGLIRTKLGKPYDGGTK